WNWILRKWFGILAVVTGLLLFLMGLTSIAGWQLPASGTGTVETTQMEPDWIINDIDGAFAKAAAEHKPIMMDFYADWCVACVELDHKTYNQPEIIDRSKKFVNLKIDFTAQNDWSKKITAEYDVKGMPTVIFFTPDGTELVRFVGFKNAAGVAKIMDRTLAASE
ncbi:thioredoxin family protein, partial [bacterium]|nr:thioredoxin family protein [bacterium]